MAKRTSSAESPALADTGTRDGNLKGKVAFVTGAVRGQGRAHAVRLASEGADFIAVDLCEQIATVPYSMTIPDDLAATVKLVEDTGARIVAQKTDVRDRTSLTAALQAGSTSSADSTLSSRTPGSHRWPQEMTAGATWSTSTSPSTWRGQR